MDNLDLLKEQWQAVLDRVKEDNDLSKVTYSTWLEPLELHRFNKDTLTFIVPSGSMGVNILNRKYTKMIRAAIMDVTGLDLQISYITPDTAEQIAQGLPPESLNSDLSIALERANLNPKYSFDTFVVGSNNKFAHAASLAVAESPGEIYNPLYLYAGVGLGKTHLMHSIAHFILEQNVNARILYVTSEDFTNELIDAIRNSNSTAMTNFREKYRNIDVLMIDDIQFLIGKESTQEEFFHTFEALYGAKKQIIISSDKPPKDLDILEERIRSRLEMGLIADISSPDYETRMAILRKKEEQDGYKFDDSVLEYIATNINSNIRELEGCLNRVRAKAVLEKREVNLALAQEILEDLIAPEKDQTLSSKMIIKVVADHFNITLAEICSQKREKRLSYPRMIAMYLCREMTEDSLLTIANSLSKKDHTTVLSACKRIEKDCAADPQIQSTIDTIRKKIVL